MIMYGQRISKLEEAVFLGTSLAEGRTTHL